METYEILTTKTKQAIDAVTASIPELDDEYLQLYLTGKLEDCVCEVLTEHNIKCSGEKAIVALKKEYG